MQQITLSNFCGKPSFVDKKMDEKRRLSELSTEEIREIVDNAVLVTRKKATKFGMGTDYLKVHIS